jgi:hypothetical protein
LIVAGLAILALAAFVLATLPPAPRTVRGADASLAGRTVRGAFHVHTTRSDGSRDKSGVAAAARAAGLQFVVFTDHGDGTRPADAPEYLLGVLCLDGVEISTTGGHYVALGAAASPYPLGGDSPAVVEDVARLGGFGIAAHPGSLRQELAWIDWTSAIDGVEWLNADSEWRDESRLPLARAVAAYPIRPAGALAMLLDRPDSTLARWDAITETRRVVAIAGHDAHGGIGRRVEQPLTSRRIHVPSYEASFRAFSTRVELDRPFSGDAAADGDALLSSLKAGRFYTIVDAVATGATTLEFNARSEEHAAGQGSVLRGGGIASFSVRAAVPDGGSIVAYRNGVDIARRQGSSLEFRSGALGAYRVEVQVPGAPGQPPVPWLVSNPIFRLAPVSPPTPTPSVGVFEIPATAWRIEKDAGSEGTLRADGNGGEVVFGYRLRPGPRVSQFVAVAADLPRDLPPFDTIQFTARSANPVRLSVQLRFARDRDARWQKSVFMSSTPTPTRVAVADLRRADGPERRPDPRRATSMLLVIDLTNARPGDAGTVHLADLRLASAERTQRVPAY